MAARKKHLVLKIIPVILACVLTAGIAALIINIYVIQKTKDRIVQPDDPRLLEGGFDAVIVLGCSVLPDGSPSHMLSDRIDTGVEVFGFSGAQLLVMSGDRSENYDEVTVMSKRAISLGVSDASIAEDPEGFSTYESVFRAAKHFGFKRVIIVTQRYHLYRSLYIAGKLGLDAYGVGADPRSYSGQIFRDVREFAAIIKDFLKCSF
jgi:vancomycin permeability regulator SanA